MPTLLISLGTSPAIVPEAFLLPGVDFDTVHVLTTDSNNVGTDFVEEWFTQQAPAVHLTITRVAGFTDFTGEDDHFRFEEVLYRWWLEASLSEYCRPGDSLSENGGREASRHSSNGAEVCDNYVCLAGGFKCHSSFQSIPVHDSP